MRKKKKKPAWKSDAIQKVRRAGWYSCNVAIPKRIIASLKWREGQRVIVTEEDGAIVIREYKGRT